MKKTYLFQIICMMSLTSCTKELDFDYASVSPMYVIEAYVTNTGTSAIVTKTQNVMATESAETVDDAQITITDSNGNTSSLVSKGKGKYTSSVKGKAGVTYTLTAKMGDVVTTSTSTMQDYVKIDSCKFGKLDMAGNEMYLLQTFVADDGKALRNYLTVLYCNKLAYKMSARQNKSALNGDGTLMSQNTLFVYTESASEESKQNSWLFDGDKITGYICRLDNTSYDYYTSLSTAKSSNSNPISNFSNGVLGIFSAQYRTALPEMTFIKEQVK